MKKGMALIALALAWVSAPAAAQIANEGEKFLEAVRDFDGSKALPLMQEPGSTVVNYKGYGGEAAIHIATRERRLNWINTLLHYGADANLVDEDGETPLLIAVRNDHRAAIELLVGNGAEVDKGNRWGETPLIVAIQLKRPRTVEYLLKKGADPDKKDRAAGLSAREYAARDTRNRDLLQLIEGTEAEEEGQLKFGPILR